jgi:hypothetical protein
MVPLPGVKPAGTLPTTLDWPGTPRWNGTTAEPDGALALGALALADTGLLEPELAIAWPPIPRPTAVTPAAMEAMSLRLLKRLFLRVMVVQLVDCGPGG